MIDTVPPLDTASPSGPIGSRQHWMSVLARASAEAIEAGLTRHGALPDWTLLRGPETGLVMVRGRAGGSGSPFNLGEMTVTRCTVRTETGFVGHAYIPGRDTRHAELAAVVDALMQDADHATDLETRVIAQLERQQAERSATRASKAAATRVNFFALQTMRT